MEEIRLKSISEFLEKNPEGLLQHSFFVPAYQRGYRWTKREVSQLLEDLFDFSRREKKTGKEIYCLQPIVVKTLEKDDEKLNGLEFNGNKIYEVIDGQQRLTTIFLILKFLNLRFVKDFQKDLFQIVYETRPGSEQYLRKLPSNMSSKYVDFYHMAEAYKTIEEWFTEKENRKNRINDFESTLLNRSKVIWYLIGDKVNPIKVFSRLNIGKIPLTSAELIKALLLKSSTEVSEKMSVSEQLDISRDWNEIENTLQNDNFWFFIANKEDEFTNRIEFLLKQSLTKYQEDINNKDILRSDPLYTFLVLNYCLQGALTLDSFWKEVKNNFLILREWYEDRELYNLIGFLIATKNCSIPDLFELREKKGKALFRDEIVKKQVVESIPRNYQDLDYRKKSDKRYIHTTLLLFNILTLLQNKNSNARFQFDLFKDEEWDLEHIRSVATNKPGKKKNQEKWLDNVISYFLGDEVSDENGMRDENPLLDKILDFRAGKSEEDFDDIYEDVLEQFNENIYEETDNTIGNLTLLDQSTNRSYGNAVFPIKRKRIISNDKLGMFAPVATKNVFLKLYSSKVDNMFYWSKDDRNDYLRELTIIINDYCNFQKPS